MCIKILLLSIEPHNNIYNFSNLNIYKIIIYWVLSIGRWLSRTLTPKFQLKMILRNIFFPLLFLKGIFLVLLKVQKKQVFYIFFVNSKKKNNN